MTFLDSNELEFIVCCTCQGFPNSSKGCGGGGGEEGLEILLGGDFFTRFREPQEEWF